MPVGRVRESTFIIILKPAFSSPMRLVMGMRTSSKTTSVVLEALIDQGIYDSRLGSVTKAYVADVAMKCAHEAMQIYGGYGYSRLEEHVLKGLIQHSCLPPFKFRPGLLLLQFAHQRAAVNIGYVPDGGITYMLTQSVGPVKAAELMMSGKKFTGAEAAEWGMITKAVPRSSRYWSG